MPVYQTHACAFVHVPKTAGTALGRALDAACGESEYGGVGLWEILEQRADRAELLAVVRANFPVTTIRDFPRQHLPAAALRALVGTRQWDELFTFAFVRNPWEMVVSTYHFARAHVAQTVASGLDPDRAALVTRSSTFARFVELYPLLRSDMSAMLCDAQGNPLVTFVGRYERLTEDFTDICGRLGIDVSLTHENRSEHGAYRSYYDERTRALVAAHFARDIERFGYAF